MKFPIKTNMSVETLNTITAVPTTAGPVLETIGLRKDGIGWRVVLLRTQDGKVREEVLLTEPEVFVVAQEQFKLEAARRILAPRL
jgi:hypothetical protein